MSISIHFYKIDWYKVCFDIEKCFFWHVFCQQIFFFDMYKQDHMILNTTVSHMKLFDDHWSVWVPFMMVK
jgi:hypothetical protein